MGGVGFFDFLKSFFLAVPQSSLPNHRGLCGTKRNILSPGMTQSSQKSHCDQERPHVRHRGGHWLEFCTCATGPETCEPVLSRTS